MKTTIQQLFLLLPLVAGIVSLAGCAAKKGSYGDPKTGFNLEYRMEKGEPLQYDLTSEFLSKMEVMGQKFDVESNTQNLFTLTPHGLKNGNHLFKVYIDTAFIHIVSPQREIVPDMSKIIGHDFLFEVSPKGMEMDCSGAEALVYTMGEYEELNLASDFKTLFPDLPDRPVKQGDKWTNVDTLVEKGSTGYLEFITYNEHVIEALEPFQGFDCLKIRTTYEGSMEGEGDLQGAKTKTGGTIQGEYTWYFAYKKGILIQIWNQGHAESTTLASGEGREITIPSSRDYASVVSLIR